eukprot:1157516-Pelagomonas_calceolata.AAC.1
MGCNSKSICPLQKEWFLTPCRIDEPHSLHVCACPAIPDNPIAGARQAEQGLHIMEALRQDELVGWGHLQV